VRELVAVRATVAAVSAALDAALDGGPALLPLDPRLPPPVLGRLLATVRPHALDEGRGRQPLPDPLPVGDSVAVVLATSGSTGPPKGVLLTAAALEAAAAASLARLGGPPTGAWLSCLPPSAAGGLQVLVRSRLLGIPPVVLEPFSVEGMAGAVAAGRVARVALVPTMLARLLAAGVDLSGLDTVLVGGASLNPQLRRRAEAAGARVVTTYGLTETAGGCVYDGVPLDGVEVAVGDDGLVEVGGPVLAQGYRTAAGDVDLPRRGGRFVTADLGRLAPDGRLEVVGRADDVVVSGGVNVAADAVAAVLAEHPSVAEAAVTGRPDPEWGEVVVAVVVAGSDAAPTLAELRAAVRDRLGGAAAPRDVVVVDALPLLPGGKVDRSALRRLAGTSP